MNPKGILLLLFTSLLLVSFTACKNVPDPTAPTVLSTIPLDSATGVNGNAVISATFSEAMDYSTIVAANFSVYDNATPAVAVVGTVTYDLPTMTARFAPTVILNALTTYTAGLSRSVADLEGNKMEASYEWSFTIAAAGSGPAPVLLGTAGNFAILAKTAISTVPDSHITGDIGVSPAAETFLTGFSQTKCTGYSTSPQVVGFMYAADMTPPTPTMMTTAISDMETAYTDAAGRPTPNFVNLGTGEIGGQTLVAGLYNWGSSVTISSNLSISGASNDVWIFQISGDLSLSGGFSVLLSGGAQARNIFWQVAGETTLETASHFEGVILCQTAIIMNTGASMNGKALAQSNVALDKVTLSDVQ